MKPYSLFIRIKLLNVLEERVSRMVSLKRMYIITAAVFLVIILALTAFTSWYTVDESEQAVILTFGNAQEGTYRTRAAF